MAAEGRFFPSDECGINLLYNGLQQSEDDQQVCLKFLPLLSLHSRSVWVMATSGRAVFGRWQR